jgi:hypothetical protein
MTKDNVPFHSVVFPSSQLGTHEPNFETNFSSHDSRAACLAITIIGWQEHFYPFITRPSTGRTYRQFVIYRCTLSNITCLAFHLYL